MTMSKQSKALITATALLALAAATLPGFVSNAHARDESPGQANFSATRSQVASACRQHGGVGYGLGPGSTGSYGCSTSGGVVNCSGVSNRCTGNRGGSGGSRTRISTRGQTGGVAAAAILSTSGKRPARDHRSR